MILDLKQQMHHQLVWQNKLKKEEVKTQEQLVNEKVEKHREEIIKSIHMQNQQKIMGEVADVERR